MNRKQCIAITFQDRGRVLFENVGTLIAQLEMFGDFRDEFPEVDTEAAELAGHLYEALASARRLRNATSCLINKTEDSPFRRNLNANERTLLAWVGEERLFMWRGRLSLRATRFRGRRPEPEYMALNDKQIDAYNELLDRGLIIAPDGHGEPAKVAP